MFRFLNFLPPAGFYVFSAAVLATTWYIHGEMILADPEADTNKLWLVGGILAFLLGFGGFQRGLEMRSEAQKPRVSSADVLQKLAPMETGKADAELDVPPPSVHGPDANSPLGRLRARSEPLNHH